ncbi:MAG: hypothetical protein EAX95_16055 [Candidatus Thorarchaeota archaeon]|nr:hypothetical protein [Candidatus Thorarchaeota archaeon]
MVRAWATIARTEFRVMTARFRKKRLHVLLLILIIGLVWAFVIVPRIMSGFLDLFSAQVQQILQVAYPGVMRAVILILWTMVLIYPISYSLQEIRIGQWEIILSNNVSTRDLLFGIFLAKIPSYSLLVLFMAPLLVSPFIIFYEVSIIGQLTAYLVIAVFVLTTLLLSTVISTAIQAKLGESARGNDIAKAMGLIIVFVFLLPLYGFLYLAEAFAELLGLNVFLVLPSTWAADSITWITIYFNGQGLPSEVTAVFEGILGLGIGSDLILVGVFALAVLILGVVAPDRIFSLEAGARTEAVTTVGKENLVLRAIRRVVPGSFGSLIVIMLKDFGRKAQNTTKIVYGVSLSIIVPFMLSLSSLTSIQDPVLILVFISFFVGMILGIMGGVTFGGVGFLESKDHLWIIKSAPRGVSRFLAARIIDAFLFAIPMAMSPVLILAVVIPLPIIDSGIMLLHAYLILCSTILIGIGLTAMNPAYEDMKSSAFHINAFVTLIISLFAIILGFVIEFTTGIFFENAVLGMLVAIAPILVVGPLVLLAGALKISRIDN